MQDWHASSYCVNTCRFDNQVPKEKLVQKYFCVVEVTRYIIYEEGIRKHTSILKIAGMIFEFET